MFDVEGEVRLSFATPNCGEQSMILADVYDQSFYAAPGFCVGAVHLIWVVIGFNCHRDLEGMFHHSYGAKGRLFLNKWYDREARFFQGPSSAPYSINDPNGMDVDHINLQEVCPAPHPLEPDEELEEFGDIQYFSPPIY